VLASVGNRRMRLQACASQQRCANWQQWEGIPAVGVGHIHSLHNTPRAAGGVLRVKGRNLEESEHVKLGAYHTLELEVQRAFTLTKVCMHANIVTWLSLCSASKLPKVWFKVSQTNCRVGHSVQV
jgi:hypothetical protein